MTFEEIFRKIQSQTASVLGDGVRQGLPLPAYEGNTVNLQVIIAPMVIREPEGTILFPPSYLGKFDIVNGNLLELRAVDPSYFAQEHPIEVQLGIANMPEGMTFDSFMLLRAELFAAYDLLLPAFIQSKSSFNEQERKAADQFLTIFPQLSEAVLKPYYEYIGKDFFTWLARVMD